MPHIRRGFACLTIALCVLFASPAFARDWSVDTDHSQAVFTITHIVGKVTGFFNDITGTINFDPKHPEAGVIDISIGIDSINTGIAKRDAHLKTADFFDTAKYPRMSFVSDDIVARGDGWFEARGTFTLKETSNDITLPFTVLGQKPHPVPDFGGKPVLGFQGRFDLDRLAYGVGSGTFHKMGLVDNMVAVTLYTELLPAD